MLVSAALTEENPKEQNHNANPNHNGNPSHNMNPISMNPAHDMMPNMDYNNMNPNMDFMNPNHGTKPRGEVPKQHHNVTTMADTPKAPDTRATEKAANPTNSGKN